MVLADPGRMHADTIGVDGFLGDVADELVGGARIVFVVIVAQGEVAEVHSAPPIVHRAAAPFLVAVIIDAFATVVNATDRPADG